MHFCNGYRTALVKLADRPEHYQEGPWVYKRNGRYYMAFASTCCPEGIGYARISIIPPFSTQAALTLNLFAPFLPKSTPRTHRYSFGPWSTKGYIMRPTERTRGNHPGIIDYKGSSYVFGLNYDLTVGSISSQCSFCQTNGLFKGSLKGP